ncbi:NADP-dependent oxidoreductase [Streptomyces sp. NPDC127098]|uniref:NADP-dependent oxidoreductase n=1 Tax=Streptomyces sp. NPDC127098 TaxID=3347137 RepID=UPI00365F9047
MSRAVRFDEYGDVDVLRVDEVPRPEPGPGEVVVRIKAAGINPGEAAIRRGLLRKRWPATFPSGQGSDLAGVVTETAPDVRQFDRGDEVLGFTNHRASHAEYAAVEADQLIRRPTDVSWAEAGSLAIVGTTAYAAVRAVGVRRGDTVVVSGAAGGVGTLACQLARNLGATVIGLASEDHHGWLSDHGILPVNYGEGVAERIRAAAGGTSPDAFIDTYGADYVRLAIELGIPPERIDTIINMADAEEYGTKMEGSAAAADAGVLAELTAAVEDGRLHVPIARTYPLDDVREAFRDLERRHTLGKIVLIP